MLRATLLGTASGNRASLAAHRAYCSASHHSNLELSRRVSNMSYGGSIGITFTQKQGTDVINDPLLNRGSAFTPQERERLHISGLIPPKYSTMEQQLDRLQQSFLAISDPLQKYEYCANLQDRNEILYYRWLMENIEELAPVIYTPTVGLACQKFGVVYKRPRGMYFSKMNQNNFVDIIWNWPAKEVDVVVITDGGRILGLGDLGTNGMAIPIGKLALYVAVGGIHPARTLPIMLDVGTNNLALRKGSAYLGSDHDRLTGADYYLLVDEIMRALKRRWPRCLVQFEDFTSSEAPIVLDVYRNKTCCFNDDIQGTGGVVLAGLINALRLQQQNAADLANLRVVIVGSGSAGLGVANAIYTGMVKEGATPAVAADNVYLVDVNGLVGQSRLNEVHPLLQKFAKFEGLESQYQLLHGDNLLEVIRKVRPHALLGLTGVGGVFREDVVRLMAQLNPRPIIFPLSNPTSRAECTAEQAYSWTDGRCIFASGSPFQPVELGGRTYNPTQSNNMYIFPGVGLGTVLTKARRVTDEMFYIAAKALAHSVPDDVLEREQRLYPKVADARRTSVDIALAVAKHIQHEGLNTVQLPKAITVDWVSSRMFTPVYGPIIPQFQHDDHFTELSYL
eukprot:TRINITY_DN43557_c0_g1_i1.p1 TRINITY_DN43557_c0_g1~~TRINITY_DN43557_c0_g1_i1.p1  ORF type:complete len:621 (+),score=162.40 TRINITY_DN43557_c0_g1_i1:70-1932(+)